MKGDYRDYENGVADVLRVVVGDAATVERDVRLPGRRSGVPRQIDVVVRGRIFGLETAVLAVECKKWNVKLDVGDVERFLSFLDDVGADLGLLVTTVGYSAAAKRRAADARGVRTELLSLTELERWSPVGTGHVSYRVPAVRSAPAREALSRAGLRVRQDEGLEHTTDEVILQAYRFENAGETPSVAEIAASALAAVGVPVQVAASGTTMAGGTPAHRWLEVVDTNGMALGVKVLVDGEAEIEKQLSSLAESIGYQRNALDVRRPRDWPTTGLFGLPTS